MELASLRGLRLESISEEFNLFSPGGVPLRAKLNVSFREAWTISQQLQVTPRHSSDRTTLHRVVRGETICQIAYEFYDDPTQWRLIADANNLDNPRLLTPGQVLTIPPSPTSTNTSGINTISRGPIACATWRPPFRRTFTIRPGFLCAGVSSPHPRPSAANGPQQLQNVLTR